MFPAFCLATYFLFSSYWLLRNKYKKQKQKQKKEILLKGETTKAETKIEMDKYFKIDLIQGKPQVDQQQISNNSVKDELDIAMIENQELDKNIQQEEPSLKQNITNEENQIVSPSDKETTDKVEKTYKPILKNLVDNNQEYESDEDPPSPFQSYLIEREKRLKQQKMMVQKMVRQSGEEKPEELSEFQLIQALSNQRKSNKLNQPSSQIIPQIDQKQIQEDTEVATLIQQMDFLFQNNPSSFLRLMNRYKIQQSPDLKNKNHERQMEEKIQQLQMELKRKNSQVGIKQIQIFQYKSVSDGKQAEVEALKTQKSQLEQKISELQKQSKQLRQKIQKITDQNIQKEKKYNDLIQKQKQQLEMVEQFKKKNEELEGQIQQLQIGVTDIQSKEDFFKNERKILEQKLLNLTILKDKQINNLKQEFKESNEKKELQFKNKLEQLKLEIQKLKKQSNQEKNKHQLVSLKSDDNSNLNLQIAEKQKNENSTYFAISTRDNLGQSSISEGNQKYSNEDIRQLHKTIQNLKNQIEFSQTQMRMLQNSQANHLQKIQSLQKIIEQKSSPEVMDLRQKIFRLQPLADQYEVMRKKYLQMKILYQTLLHQKQKKKEKIAAYLNGQRDSPTSQIIPTSLNRKQSKLSSNNQNSPVNSGKSVLSHSKSNESKNNGCYRFLFDCQFVIYEERQFIYDTLSKLLKGIIKTEKLYNSKTNGQKNPHQLIDNIRGILVVIQLKNNKILGAYTHEGFSQIHPHSTKQNIGFILDITNRKSFANQSGINSIIYYSKSLVWGLNEIMLKYEEPQILYTNFCRNHNIYWDGKHKIEQFIGQQKQWAPIEQYELFRVSKI